MKIEKAKVGRPNKMRPRQEIIVIVKTMKWPSQMSTFKESLSIYLFVFYLAHVRKYDDLVDTL